VPVRLILALVFCNVVWSAHPAMGKFLLEGFPPEQAAWLRYASAFLLLLVALRVRRQVRPGARRVRANWLSPRAVGNVAWLQLVGVGLATFCISPLLQLGGLTSTQAVDNAVIVAMEPLMTVGLACLLLKERLTRETSLAFAVALLGFCIFSGLNPPSPAGGSNSHLLGNLAILLSLIGESLYSVGGRRLTRDHSAVAVFAMTLGIGVVGLTLATAITTGLPTFASLGKMTARTALGLFWLGPLGTGVAYLVWMRALVSAPVSSLALSLFIQPVLGPLWGMIFLGERLSLAQCGGGLLIFVAVSGQVAHEVRLQKHNAARLLLENESDPTPDLSI
jgi:drug/metabolite transporter (DMT)-like permease